MKIIHLILGKARLNRMNGVNQVAHYLARHQAAAGHNVDIWGITANVHMMPEGRPYTLRLFQSSNSKISIDPTLKKAIRSLNRSDSCVHLHGSFIPEFYHISHLLSKQKVRYVYCPHGALSPGALERNSLKKRVYFRLFEASVIRRAHAVHMLGREQADHLDQYFPIPHKVCIPNGLDPESLEFRSTPLERPDALLLSFCGRLDAHHKGLDLMLKGFASYIRAGGNGHIWLIGEGPDQSLLEELGKKLNISDRLHFWGSRFGPEKLNILSHSDIFVHTSRYEGMPISVLEAAGLGLPCMLSSATNLADAVVKQGAGFHTGNQSPEQIAGTFQAVESAWQQGQLPKMGQHARRMIETHHHWSDIATELIWLYTQAFQRVLKQPHISV